MLKFFAMVPLCVVMMPVVFSTEGNVKVLALAIQVALLLFQITCAVLSGVINRQGYCD